MRFSNRKLHADFQQQALRYELEGDKKAQLDTRYIRREGWLAALPFLSFIFPRSRGHASASRRRPAAPAACRHFYMKTAGHAWPATRALWPSAATRRRPLGAPRGAPARARPACRAFAGVHRGLGLATPPAPFNAPPVLSRLRAWLAVETQCFESIFSIIQVRKQE